MDHGRVSAGQSKQRYAHTALALLVAATAALASIGSLSAMALGAGLGRVSSAPSIVVESEAFDSRGSALGVTRAITTAPAPTGLPSTAPPPTSPPPTATITATAPISPTSTQTPVVSPSPTLGPTPSPTVEASPTAIDTPLPTPTPPPTEPPSPTPMPTRSGISIYLPISYRLEALPFPVFGVQVSELRFRDTALIDQSVEVGAAWYRTFFYWDEVEPVRTSPPTYDWRHYDGIVTHASEHGLRIIAEMSGNPTWAADVPGGPVYDYGTLSEFMAAAVERYDGDGVADAPGSPIIRFWEMYNEPDNRDLALARQGRGWGYLG